MAPTLDQASLRAVPFVGLQVIGPFNSGTSLMYSYPYLLGSIDTGYHYGFWKHSLPPDWVWVPGCRWDRSSGGPTPALLSSILLIAMVRNPYFWIVSTALSGYDVTFLGPSRGGSSERLHCRVRFGSREFANLAELWNAYYLAYAEHLDPFGARYVRLEDLVADPYSVVRALGNHIAIDDVVTQRDLIEQIRATPAKDHHREIGRAGEGAAQLYQVANVRRMLGATDLEQINSSLDEQLMTRFGYPRVL
jgi:hypothetical protein